MSILWAGTSIGDGVWVGTQGAGFDFATANVGPGAAEGIWFGNGSLAQRAEMSIEFPAEDDFWISYNWYNPGATVATGASYDHIGFYNKAYSTTNALLKLQAVSNVMTNYYWNGSAYVSDGTVPMITSNLHRIDIHVVIADTGGKMDVYQDNTLIGSLTITDTLLVGAAAIDMIKIGQYHVNGSNGVNVVSSIFVMDEDTRDFDFYQRNPTGNGAETAWTGTYTSVAKTTINDATMITSNTTGQFETYSKAALPTQYADADVQGVVLSARARTSSLAIKGVARVGSTNYLDTAEETIGSAFGPAHYVFNNNPATSSPWSVAEIDSAQFGVKSE